MWSGGCDRVVAEIHFGRGVIAVPQLQPDGRAAGVVEEPDAVTEQHRRDVQVELVDQAPLEELSADRG
jgi:hypothetical protein